MPTKVTRLTETAQTEKKKIEFKMCLRHGRLDINISDADRPNNWDNITLLKLGYNLFDGQSLDLMLANDDDSTAIGLYLGHFNDGVV